jgi:thioredoxin 1
MKKFPGLLFAVVSVILMAQLGHAGELDTALAKAKKEGKAVMLELGSVGCIPCDKMKPVMEKLRVTYAGKLDVIFIDVKKDRDTGDRFDAFFLPTQVFLDKEGKEFHRHYGFYAYDEITPVLKKQGL